jgi:uncharacterized SAM-binding protein YcdF (DUF218 family)
MPRSIGLFRKAGFKVEACPVDWRVGNRSEVFEMAGVAGYGLDRTDVGVREWIGLLAYRITGQIDHLLPGPVAN